MSMEKGTLESSKHSNGNVAFAVTSVLNEHQLDLVDRNATYDDATLGALGYKQEFKRCFLLP